MCRADRIGERIESRMFPSFSGYIARPWKIAGRIQGIGKWTNMNDHSVKSIFFAVIKRLVDEILKLLFGVALFSNILKRDPYTAKFTGSRGKCRFHRLF